jgi:hypothetical protein
MTIEDQPKPIPNEKPNIADLVSNDIQERKRIGTERYGTPLQPFNGRNGLVDLYQELLDATQYIRQVIEEDDKPMMLCNAGCGCRLFGGEWFASEHWSDADASDCACGGPCQWDNWEQFIRDVLTRPEEYYNHLPEDDQRSLLSFNRRER